MRSIWFGMFLIMFGIGFLVGADTFHSGEQLADQTKFYEVMQKNAELGESFAPEHYLKQYDDPDLLEYKFMISVNKTIEAGMFISVELLDLGFLYGYEYHPDTTLAAIALLLLVAGVEFLFLPVILVFAGYVYWKDRSKRVKK